MTISGVKTVACITNLLMSKFLTPVCHIYCLIYLYFTLKQSNLKTQEWSTLCYQNHFLVGQIISLQVVPQKCVL